MPNDELKERIKEILRKRMTELLGSCHTDEIPLTEEGAEAFLFYADEFADALIAAGIGDVKTAQEIGASATAMAVLDAAKAEHRAARAERALLTACIKMVKYEKSDVNTELLVGVIYRKYLKQAEKELSEEKK